MTTARLLLLACMAAWLPGQVVQSSQVPQNYATTTATSNFTAQSTIPALPSLGAANSIFKDPTHGNRILRVSDGTTLTPLGLTNYSLNSPSSAESSIWRRDGLEFYSGSPVSDGALLFSFDPATLQSTLLTTAGFIKPGGSPEFSYQHNLVMYGAGPPTGGSYRFVSCDPSSMALCGVLTTVFDYGASVGISTGNSGDPSVSANEILAVPTNGSGQDNWVDVVVYCVETNTSCTAGQFTVLDYTQGIRAFGSGSYTGQSTGVNWQPTWKIHNARIGKEGRYVAITTQGVNSPYEVIWDIVSNTTQAIYSSDLSGHKAQGYNNMLAGAPAGSFHSYGPTNTLVPSLASANTFTNILPLNLNPPEIGGVSDYQSMQNADPNYLVPAFGSTTTIGSAGVAAYLGNGEIIAVEIDGARNAVWRFAGTRSPYVAYSGPLYTSAVSVHSGGGGSGYAVNDTGTVTGCNGSITPYAIYHVSTVSGGAVTALTITYGGGWYAASSSACATTRTTGSGSGLTLDIASSLWNNFDFTTRGAVSQDGKYFLFTSVWEGTLGADAEMLGAPNLRTDIFIVELTPLTPQSGGQISPGSTLAVFNTLAPDMQSCTATAYSDSGRMMSVASAPDTVRNGRTSQILLTGLSASTTYWSKVACEGGSTNLLSNFRTQAAGSGTYQFTTTYAVSHSVKYCTDAAMTTGCTTLGAAATQIVPVASNAAIYSSVLAGTTPVDVKILVAP